MMEFKERNINVLSNNSYPAKRLLDVLASLCILIGMSPILILIGLIIKISDPTAPIFFKQTRVGKDGKEFTIFKFRTMVVDAEERLAELMKLNDVSGAMFKMKEDPRVTTCGKFLRKTSLDEFPQLLNVLLGSMSIVGPRPPLPKEVAMYSAKDRLRLSVLPGCTGLWQISGRNDVDFDEMVTLDLLYIEGMSLGLDLKILFNTVKVVLTGDGAY